MAPMRTNGWRWAATAVAIGGLVLGTGPSRAALPGVKSGLWHVQMLRTGLKDGPQARSYTVCLDAERARAPMMPAQLPPRAELIEGRRELTMQYVERGPDQPPRQVEMRYYWLDAQTFEGTHDVESGPGTAVRMQYRASWVGRDCGARAPRPMAANGEP